MFRRLTQAAFTGGEIAPENWARTDIEKYGQGLKTGFNFVVRRAGGAVAMVGTEHVCRVSDDAFAHALTPFKFNGQQNYIHIWGNLSFRVIKDGALVLEPSQAIEDITQAAPGVVEITGHGFADGDWVYSTGIGGMTDLNARYFIVDNATSDTFTLTDLDGNQIDTDVLPAWTSGGVFAKVAEFVSPYTAHNDPNNAAAQAFFFDYAQSNDEAFFAHKDVAPHQLTRSDHHLWTMAPVSFGATLAAPAGINVTAPVGTGAITYTYTVTAHNDATNEESIAGTADDITNDLSADPTYYNLISWSAVTDATRYSIYKDENGIKGYIGGTTDLSFKDGLPDEYTPDLAFTPPTNVNPFPSSGKYPHTVEFHEGRLYWGQTDEQPGAFYASQPLRPRNMNRSTPQRADDALSGRLLPGVNPIMGMASLGRTIVMLTEDGEFTVSGGSVTDVVTPSGANSTRRISAYGADRLKPLVIGGWVLFVKDKGHAIIAVGPDGQGGVASADITLLAPHIFEGRFVVSWCFQKDPHNLVWMALDDGTLAIVTFVPEQGIVAFMPGALAGDAIVESVASIPGANEDEVYFESKRGAERHVERLVPFAWGGDRSDPAFPNVATYWGLHNALGYDGAPLSEFHVRHLPGRTDLAALADGFLITGLASDAAGKVTLPAAQFPNGASKVVIGLLPADPELEPLPVAQPDNGAPQGRRKRVKGVVMKLFRACGVKAGSNADSLYELKLRPAATALGAPTPPVSGDFYQPFAPAHSKDGTFVIRGTAGLPLTVAALYPEVEITEAKQPAGHS